MGRLGQLAKQAQDPYMNPMGQTYGSIVSGVQQGQQQNVRHAQLPQAPRYGFGDQSRGQGFLTGQGIAGSALNDIFGQGLGPILGMVGMPWLTKHLESAGIDMQQPLQTGYGGSPEVAREQAAIGQQLMMEQLKNQPGVLAEVSRTVGAKAGELAQQMGLGEEGAGAIKAMGDQLGRLVESNPITAAMVMMPLAQQFPALHQLFIASDPEFVTDFSPLVRAAYARSGGDGQKAAALIPELSQNFFEQYRSGRFGDVPSQVAMAGMAHTMEELGPNATWDQIGNVAQAAHAFTMSGLAPTFGSALSMMDVSDPNGVARDPSQAINVAAFADQAARSGQVSREQLGAAAQMAQQQGINPMRAISYVMAGGQARGAVGGAAGNRMGGAATDTMSNLGNSTAVRTLAAIHEMGGKGREAVERAIASGDMGSVNKLVQKARRMPQVMRRINNVNSEQFLDIAAGANPASMQMLAYNDLQQGLKQRFGGGRVSPAMKRVMSSPDELARRVRENDWSGLSAREAKTFRGGSFGDRITGTMLTGDWQSRKPHQTPRAPTPEPVSRLGRNFPTKPEAAAAPVTTKPFKPTPIQGLP